MRKRSSGIFRISNTSNKESTNRTRRAISLIEQVCRVPFSVYGPDDQPFRLTMRSFSVRGFSDKAAMGIGFTFANSSQPTTGETLRIESSDTKEPGILYPSLGAAVRPEFNLHHSVFQQYHLESDLSQFAQAFSRWEGELIVSDETFSGEIYFWIQPYPLSLFLFKGEHAYLSGNTFGLSFDQLKGLLQQLTPLNHREDILKRYQQEFDEEKQRLRNQS